MATQFTEFKKELKNIEITLTKNLMFNNLPKGKEKELLDRAQFLRSFIYMMQ